MPQKPNFLLIAVAVMAVVVLGGARTQSDASVSLLALVFGDIPKMAPDSTSKLPPMPVEATKEPIAEETEEVQALAWQDTPNVCESFTATRGKPKYKNGKRVVPMTYHRNRYQYTVSDRERTKEIIRLVAREMGVTEPDFFVVLATHESSLQPESVHILNGDLRANRQTWARYDYTPAKEAALQKRMNEGGKDYWKAKAALSFLQTYKDNPHWRTKVVFDVTIPPLKLRDGTTTKQQVVQENRSVWQFGYGLYGHNAVYYTKTWGKEAPPWVLCAHQGIVATIVEVWVARENVQECAYLSRTDPKKYGTAGATYLNVLGRLATGKCGKKKFNDSWTTLIERYGDGKNPAARGGSVPWSSKPNFGTKWDRASTDRQAILEYMLKRVEEEGLLREQPLERKKKASPPEMVANL